MKNINYSLFFKANLLFTSLIFISFLYFNNEYDFLTFMLLVTASISSASLLYFIYYILLFVFKFTNKLIIYMSLIVFLLTNIALIVDFFIFKIYKFHINAMVINILTSPDAFDSIQLGIAPIALFIFMILLLVGLEVFLIVKIFNNDAIRNENLNRRLNKSVIIPLYLIFFIEKITYGSLSLMNKNETVSKFKVIPLYQPFTFSRIAAKFFDYKPDVEIKNTINTNSKLIYPKNKLIINENPNTFNIFIFASDSVKNTIINKNTSPYIEKFKEDSMVFNNHHSGGNATRFGVFSLMYGVNSTYWFNFLHASKGAIIFDVLKGLEYKIDIISSTNTSWPEFRKTCYVNVLDSIKDDFEGKPWEKDKKSTQYFLDMIEAHDTNKPLFSFVFLDAPHGYSFPKEYDKFNAKSDGLNYLTANKDIKSTIAKYKNAVYYNDSLLSKMIEKLKEKNLYDNSLIIYTSDHGEEFYEYGFFGHNSSFSKAQTNVPFIIKLPKPLKNNIEIRDDYMGMMTSHNDVVPTILSLIGVSNNTTDYSNGQNIFSKQFKRDYVLNANWNNNAIITKQNTYVFSNLPNKMFKNEVRKTETYKKIKNKKINSKILLDVMNENRYFLK
jgi:membrane-anchored protein YejM (alkaline phosphatase superfamily)